MSRDNVLFRPAHSRCRCTHLNMLSARPPECLPSGRWSQAPMSETIGSAGSYGPAVLSSNEADTHPAVRAQTAVVRSLADATAQVGLSSETAAALQAQLAEEMTRLQRCIEQVAAGGR